MRIDARLKKIEKQVYGDGKGPTLFDILKGLPGKSLCSWTIRQLLIENLPSIGLIDLQEMINILPDDFREQVIQKIIELRRATKNKKEGS